MAASIWPMPMLTGATVARMPRCRNRGYFVLRFLAEDLGKRLNEVLDAIQRALAHQRTLASK